MAGKTFTVLLIEDDSADREIITRVIDESGFSAKVDVVSTGDEALDYLLNTGREKGRDNVAPGLILLDLNLPGMSGFDLLQKLKAEPGVKNIPVIVLSTSDAPEDINQCYALGASSFVTKPSSLQGFVDIMRQIERYWFDIVSLPGQVA
ncbi:response regulator [Hyphococcus luteus]|uniref:Response regulatory domain-containing protein n=1 Tax=Hyphococcus luteus TaxID=2058213 RepID=A0A2S7KA28_9PROT|nr:response regulator [Marinicaulis flavus]PQA89374.1 hypothetical protein CW354_00410 [Marinicaulis flavus]